MKRTKFRFKGYVITNNITGKKYVGITSNTIEHRFNVHITDAKNKKVKVKPVFHAALLKYGIDNFSIELIMTKPTWEEICQWEISTIKEMNTKIPNGYNMTEGGEGAFGVIRTKEFIENLSKKKKEFYSDPINREKARNNCNLFWKDNEQERAKSKRKSKKLWQDINYIEKTVENNKRRWDNPELRKRHKEAIIKATTNNSQWVTKMKIKNIEQAKDPEWRKKVKQGCLKSWKNPERKIKLAKCTQAYWDEGHENRRKHQADVLRKTINDNLQNPDYIKWRLNNPPNGKPILFNHLYFRSIQEVSSFFKISRAIISRDIKQNKEGCMKLPIGVEYPYQIQY